MCGFGNMAWGGVGSGAGERSLAAVKQESAVHTFGTWFEWAKCKVKAKFQVELS